MSTLSDALFKFLSFYWFQCVCAFVLVGPNSFAIHSGILTNHECKLLSQELAKCQIRHGHFQPLSVQSCSFCSVIADSLFRTTDDGIGSLCPEKEPLSPRTSQRLVAGASFLVNTTSGGLSSLKKKALSKSSSPKPDNMCSPPTTPNTTSYANPTPTIPSLSLAPPPRPSSRPMSSPRQTKREGQRPSGPDELPLPGLLSLITLC